MLGTPSPDPRLSCGLPLHDTAYPKGFGLSLCDLTVKRPENAQFLPGSHFLTFFFDPTGDTNANAWRTLSDPVVTSKLRRHTIRRVPAGNCRPRCGRQGLRRRSEFVIPRHDLR